MKSGNIVIFLQNNMLIYDEWKVTLIYDSYFFQLCWIWHNHAVHIRNLHNLRQNVCEANTKINETLTSLHRNNILRWKSINFVLQFLCGGNIFIQFRWLLQILQIKWNAKNQRLKVHIWSMSNCKVGRPKKTKVKITKCVACFLWISFFLQQCFPRLFISPSKVKHLRR